MHSVTVLLFSFILKVYVWQPYEIRRSPQSSSTGLRASYPSTSSSAPKTFCSVQLLHNLIMSLSSYHTKTWLVSLLSLVFLSIVWLRDRYRLSIAKSATFVVCLIYTFRVLSHSENMPTVDSTLYKSTFAVYVTKRAVYALTEYSLSWRNVESCWFSTFVRVSRTQQREPIYSPSNFDVLVSFAWLPR